MEKRTRFFYQMVRAATGERQGGMRGHCRLLREGCAVRAAGAIFMRGINVLKTHARNMLFILLNFSEDAKTEEKHVDEKKEEEEIVKIDPKVFEMKPLEVAPKIAIAAGVYLIPAEKV